MPFFLYMGAEFMKIALVTGGNKGIGLEVAINLQKLGYKSVINYFSDDTAAKKAREEYGFYAVKCDVSVESEVKKMVSEVIEKFGKIDVLVNCAGIALKQKILLDVECSEMTRTIGVNLLGTILTSKAVLENMIKNRSGVIINISSVYGEKGGSCEVVYSATKGGINAFTKALSKEVSGANIRVNAVAPGFIDTQMNAHISDEERREFCEEVPAHRIGTVKDVASAVCFLVENTYITGAIIPVDGGMQC